MDFTIKKRKEAKKSLTTKNVKDIKESKVSKNLKTDIPLSAKFEKFKEKKQVSQKKEVKKTKEKIEESVKSGESKKNDLIKHLKNKKKVKKKSFFNKKPKKHKQSILEKKHQLEDYLLKAGFKIKADALKKKTFLITLAVVSLLTIVSIAAAIINKKAVLDILLFNFGLWTAIFAAVYLFVWGFIYFTLDIRIYSRTKQVEEVLPDFLQLTSANISAGMPIDKALWFSIRPNFGILAKDIEEVAKATVAGEELGDSLINLSNKYDSIVLKRSINLLLEGMDSGGEMADLLNKIATDIQESRILKQEMGANVATYAIFITFASIGAAPILFALATQLLKIVISIAGGLDLSSSSSFSFEFSATQSMVDDFKIFCMMMLTVSSVFSAAIVAVIRKGKVKEGIRSIPLFVIISLILYYVAAWFLGKLLGGLIG